MHAVSGARSGLRRAADYAWLLGDWLAPPATPATEAQAMGLPPFGRSVALLANAIASTGWHAERWNPDLGVDVRLPDQPAVVTDPYPLVTPWHYRWGAGEDLILYGNHFALLGELDFRTLRPGWLAPVPADDVWILTDPARPFDFQWAIGGAVFDPDEILHVSSGNRSGEILGRGVIAQYGAALGGLVAAEDHASGFFSGGALPPAVISADQVVTQDQATELKAKWRTLTSTREPVVLPRGITLTPVVGSAVDAQLVEARKWGAELAAMVVGVPGWKLGLPGPSMTYQNIETADIDFVRDSVDRFARPLSEAFTKWLMPRGTSVVWDYASRMRADGKTTAEIVTGLDAAGILTTDEARAVLGRPPLATVDETGSTPAGVPELNPSSQT